MRLVTYQLSDAAPRAGVLVDGGDRVADLGRLARTAGVGDPAQPAVASVRGLLALGDAALVAVARVAATDRGERALADVRLLAPVPDPQKILCLGLNYRDHAAEAGMALPATPVVFGKWANSLAGPHDPIVLPAASDDVDYEAELAVVVGRRARHVSPADALDHLAGAMAFNDVSARDLQLSASQWTLGKAIDGFAPCGPALVTLDELGDLQDLRVGTRLNGETMQAGTTSEMVFAIADVVALLSTVMTLEPGDVLATGTPAGVGMGRTPRVSLAPGDVVEVEVEGVGVLRNPVVAEPVPLTATRRPAVADHL